MCYLLATLLLSHHHHHHHHHHHYYYYYYYYAGVCVGLITMVFLINLAINIENNDSRIACIPKEEYMRVLTGIMNSSSEGNKGNVNDDHNGYENDRTVQSGLIDDSQPNDQKIGHGGGIGLNADRLLGGATTPRSSAMAKATLSHLSRYGSTFSQRNSKAMKRDSFHFLQKTLMRRAEDAEAERYGRNVGARNSNGNYTSRSDDSSRDDNISAQVNHMTPV
jgi:hypothetical protein